MAQLFRYMDTVGDGSGTTNFIGDYSSAAEQALLVPGALERFEVARLIVSVEDTAGMQAQEYGNLGAALTNGITIKSYNSDDTVNTDVTAGIPIKTNAQWGALCYDVDLKTWGAGDELLVVRFTLAKSGQPMILDGRDGEYLAINLNDDFDPLSAGLKTHRFMIQGTR